MRSPVLKLMVTIVGVVTLCACATENSDRSMAGMSADARKIAEEAAAKGGADGDKVSLDATIDRYQNRSVKLVDDETKETKIICKYVKATGTRFGQKICATPDEWESMRKIAKDDAKDVQRSLTNQTCPGC